MASLHQSWKIFSQCRDQVGPGDRHSIMVLNQQVLAFSPQKNSTTFAGQGNMDSVVTHQLANAVKLERSFKTTLELSGK